VDVIAVYTEGILDCLEFCKAMQEAILTGK